MRIREPRQGWVAFLWVWGLLFGGIPLIMLAAAFGGGEGFGGGPPVLLLLLFPSIATLVLGSATRRSLRSGFELEEDGIFGAHDAELDCVEWGEIDHIAWRWAEETSGVLVNGRPLPDGYALYAVLADGREVRLMQRVAPRYGQQQRINDQMARAQAKGVLRVPFDATIPTHDGGEWTGTPPSRSHTTWSGDDLPPPTSAPSRHEDDPPVWPTK